ncbi:hypothetical protein J6590_043528 [Homalodisca vitripennis]|nr:hypothetical protein J6590_043528 [Homalodisca vitripennis]
MFLVWVTVKQPCPHNSAAHLPGYWLQVGGRLWTYQIRGKIHSQNPERLLPPHHPSSLASHSQFPITQGSPGSETVSPQNDALPSTMMAIKIEMAPSPIYIKRNLRASLI